MTDITLFNETDAPAASRPILDGAKKGLGFVPNLYAALAGSPAALKAYTTLGDIYGETSFTKHEQQVVYLATSFENACHYCMAAHSTLAQGVNVDADVIDALRKGEALADPKLEALRSFTGKVTRERGWVGDADVQAFLDAGYTQANVIEVILGVAHKTISNYLNHIAATPVDAAFKPNAWTKPEPVDA